MCDHVADSKTGDCRRIVAFFGEILNIYLTLFSLEKYLVSRYNGIQKIIRVMKGAYHGF